VHLSLTFICLLCMSRPCPFLLPFWEERVHQREDLENEAESCHAALALRFTSYASVFAKDK
jgi:hypothetical protein